MVRFEVRLFASLRERAGVDSLEIELPEGATAGQLLERLGVLRPELAGGGSSHGMPRCHPGKKWPCCRR
jgi:molybdopterin converting factor small subunit